jgi:hypothetical protein
VAVGSLSTWYYLRPRIVEVHQIANWTLVHSAAAWVEQYHAVTGAYPLTLSTTLPGSAQPLPSTRDIYRHPLHYDSDGYRFLLASFGRDDRKDEHEYSRDSPTGDGHRVCRDENVDTVVSSDGIFQVCGK